MLVMSGNDNDATTQSIKGSIMTVATAVLFKQVTLGHAGLAGLTAITNKLNARAERHGMNKLVVRVVRVVREWFDDSGDSGASQRRRHPEALRHTGTARTMAGQYSGRESANHRRTGGIQ